jgi:hypothetical protein
MNKNYKSVLLSLVLTLTFSCNSSKRIHKLLPERWLFLEEGFKNDRVKIFNGKKLIADTIITTNKIKENAFTYVFRANRFRIKINNDTNFYISSTDSIYAVFIIKKKRNTEKFFLTKAVDTSLVRE